MSRDETTCGAAVPAGRVQAPIPAGTNENNGEARQGSQEAPPANEIGSRDLTAPTGRSDHLTAALESIANWDFGSITPSVDETTMVAVARDALRKADA